MFTKSVELPKWTNVLPILLALAAPATAFAASPRSASYRVVADTLDAGGARSSSGTYSVAGSFGTFGGVSRGASQMAKHGYSGQMYQVVRLILDCANTNLDEAARCQLAARAILDDGTRLDLRGDGVFWRAVHGPVVIDEHGVTSADFVYRTTEAVVCGEYLGQTNVLTLAIRNVGSDDCGAYAADGLADEWQVRYFGENNSAARPLADPDGDGQNNGFEFAAGLAPNDAQSRFTLSIESVPGHPTHRKIAFSPRFPDREYAVQYCDYEVAGNFRTLTETAETDAGTERTVLDLNATSANRFYRITITLP